jgi:hypothetical protein
MTRSGKVEGQAPPADSGEPIWKLSKKGNMWCKVGDLVLTVFYVGGSCKWCISDESGPTYSRQGYVEIEDAMEAVVGEVNDGW